ncbi:tRNA adenosine(34) deaminase TadA [Peptoniphilus stercorisuis]|uniref:tRNA-specific adenosine deaminase n=1 Tax=Peptoniphilus stercorisuis TaxID=1436965 RepID=A0ABS4K9R8_9FIRM|nr:tRNA adenosine(34) deaminase TadA [Peptoniphilus stercorisuis]MBP2024523.1 tRNA(adenine34) deaminase [Peptoniphilus stercorisuis]
MNSNHEFFMNEALKLAQISYDNGDIPIGAVVVLDNKIIGCGYNRKELLQDGTEHAEIMALKEASKNLNSHHLDDCNIYITLEPCVMCAGAILNCRINNVFVGARNKRFGACGSYINILDMDFNHRSNVFFGVLEKSCSSIISKFFKNLRNSKN